MESVKGGMIVLSKNKWALKLAEGSGSPARAASIYKAAKTVIERTQGKW